MLKSDGSHSIPLKPSRLLFITLIAALGLIVLALPATASADAFRHTNNSGNYTFGLSLDNAAATVAAADRQIEFVATTDVDVIHQEVSTALGFDNVTGGPHTVRFMARKADAGSADMTVRASSIILVCIKKQL